MKFFYSTLLALSSTSFLFGQAAPAIDWQRCIGGNYDDTQTITHRTPDGGYMVAGSSQSGVSGDKTEAAIGSDYWVLKLDSARNIIWQNNIGSNSWDYFHTMQLTPDGGCILGGKSNSKKSADKHENLIGLPHTTFFDYWVVKIDMYGGLEWENTIGGYDEDNITSIVPTSDGGYIVGGDSNSDITGDKTSNTVGADNDYWIVKLTAFGNIMWQKDIGGDNMEYFSAIRQTTDGGYILAGFSYSGISGNKAESNIGDGDYWIVKLNSLGDIVWENTIGGSGVDFPHDIKQTPDGGYIVVGYSASPISGDKTQAHLGEEDYWIIKLNSSGAPQWQKTLGGTKQDEAMSVDITPNGYIIGGFSSSNSSATKTENHIGAPGGSRCDYWVVKLDTTGNEIWDNTIGTPLDDVLQNVDYEADGGYLLSGYTSGGAADDKTSPQIGSEDFWIVKLLPEVGCDLSPVITASGPTTFCDGGNVTLNTATGVGYTYQWKQSGVNIAGATSASYITTVGGTYTVEVTNAICSQLSPIFTVTVFSKPSATVSNLDATNNVCLDPSIKLKANSGASYTYQWNKNGSVIAGATGQLYYATSEGNYKVKVTNATGCNKTSASYTIINVCRLQDEQQASGSEEMVLIVYPNPSKGFFTIQLQGQVLYSDPIYISVKNMLGEEIYTEKCNNPNALHTIQLDDGTANGVYTIETIIADKRYLHQIIVAR